MPELKVGKETLEIDEKGFLQQTDRWSEAVALLLARSEGIEELGRDHLKIVHYLHDHYREHGVAPMVRKLCKQTGFKLSRIYELFPSGPAKGACKVAGLPNGNGCV